MSNMFIIKQPASKRDESLHYDKETKMLFRWHNYL